MIHTVQPANGAVKEYSNLIAGPNEPGLEGIALEHILGPSAVEFLALVSALPGPVQLLPNKRYALRTDGMTVNKPSNLQAEVGGDRWLQVFSDNASQEYSSNIYNAYAQYEYPGVLRRSAAPGFFWFQWNAMMNLMESNLSLAEQFHDRIGGYMHPLTKVVAANQNPTPIGPVIRTSNGMLFSSVDFGTITGPGDGTVPLGAEGAPNASSLANPSEQSRWARTTAPTSTRPALRSTLCHQRSRCSAPRAGCDCLLLLAVLGGMLEAVEHRGDGHKDRWRDGERNKICE